MVTTVESWLTFMDRLLTLGDDRATKKNYLKGKMIQLIDIYYDALDAPKSGKKDKSKTPGGKHVMDLVAVDWFKDTKRMDHVARRSGCAAQPEQEFRPPMSEIVESVMSLIQRPIDADGTEALKQTL